MDGWERPVFVDRHRGHDGTPGPGPRAKAGAAPLMEWASGGRQASARPAGAKSPTESESGRCAATRQDHRVHEHHRAGEEVPITGTDEPTSGALGRRGNKSK